MGENSAIEWTTHTFNPWIGCTAVSPGCDHCYAERLAKRLGVGWGVSAARRPASESYWQQPLKWARAANRQREAWDTALNDEERHELQLMGAEAPSRPRVFCASMADVFDKDAPEGARERLWKLIEATPALDWLLLTKRVGNVPRMVPEAWMRDGFPPNVWLGISVVNQEEADRDIPKLLALPALVRFLSCEPLLGPIDLWPMLDKHMRHGVDRDPLSWVIVGGESGPGARPMHPDWARSLRDQCIAAGVPFFFKQWGEWAPALGGMFFYPVDGCSAFAIRAEGRDTFRFDDGLGAVKLGKKAAGRLLDGREWSEFPRAA